jgi:formate dehydrogenase maturation protein FdhE
MATLNRLIKAEAIMSATNPGSFALDAIRTAIKCIEMLKQIQHSSSDEADNACCPVCGTPEGKHAKGCELWALIKEG